MSEFSHPSQRADNKNRTNEPTVHEVNCLLHECKDEYRDTKYLILTDNKIKGKYKNKISYHLTICFLAENTTMRFISC